MTQQQAQKELQEIERIAEAILPQETEYKGIELPRGQRCGTHYQQRSYAMIKARELFNQQQMNIIEYVNDENEAVGNFLLNSARGLEILKKCKNSSELEKEVIQYHNKKGIPNWEFEDNYDEGIDWVCFGDLYNTIKNYLNQLNK